jgi:hypothetical protein
MLFVNIACYICHIFICNKFFFIGIPIGSYRNSYRKLGQNLIGIPIGIPIGFFRYGSQHQENKSYDFSKTQLEITKPSLPHWK